MILLHQNFNKRRTKYADSGDDVLQELSRNIPVKLVRNVKLAPSAYVGGQP